LNTDSFKMNCKSAIARVSVTSLFTGMCNSQ